MAEFLSLEGYFSRIGYKGPKTADISALKELIRLHTQSIPFENLNPFCGLQVKLDLPSIWDKIVRDKRGGYCFEQNLLFQHVLNEFGFKTRGLAARVRWNIPDNLLTARGHMLLLVTLEETEYIVDVGFGGNTLTYPLILKPGIEQETDRENFRISTREDGFLLEVFLKDEYKPMYHFYLHEQLLPDYEVTSWYLSNNPTSHFVNRLIAAVTGEGVRYILSNNEFVIHRANAASEKKILQNKEEIKTLLSSVFGINISNLPNLDKSLEKMMGEQVSLVN